MSDNKKRSGRQPSNKAAGSPRLNTVAPVRTGRTDEQEPGFDIQGQVDGETTLVDHVRRKRNALSGVLISFIVHTSLLLALALIFYTSNKPEVINIIAQFSEEKPEVLEQKQSTQTVEIEVPEEAESPIEMPETELATDDQLLTPDIEHEHFQPPAETISPFVPVPLSPTDVVASLPTGGGLSGRNAESRAKLAARLGGSQPSESAVESGIQWLLRHQDPPTGAWKLRHNGGQCNGQCGDPGTRESTTAATGLALLAIQGAGYTHRTGPYQEQVLRGLKYLVSRMKISTHGGSLRETSMYDHAIATLALSEALIMTGDESLKPTVELAMQFIVSAQHSSGGGWRYSPGDPGDITVTGWHLMALKSCRRAGLRPPDATIEKAKTFLDSLEESGGYYGYVNRGTLPVPTAVGLLSRMFLGWPRDRGELETGCAYLADLAPSATDAYFNYYATQVMFHVQPESWPRWNQKLRDYLVQTQENGGHLDGSWHFKDKHGSVGGRLYTTAMCIMTLEVYYRYLPLYETDRLERENDESALTGDRLMQ